MYRLRAMPGTVHVQQAQLKHANLLATIRVTRVQCTHVDIATALYKLTDSRTYKHM